MNSPYDIFNLTARIKSLNTWLFFDPVILRLGIYPKDVQKCSPSVNIPHSLVYNSSFLKETLVYDIQQLVKQTSFIHIKVEYVSQNSAF